MITYLVKYKKVYLKGNKKIGEITCQEAFYEKEKAKSFFEDLGVRIGKLFRSGMGNAYYIADADIEVL